MDPVGWLDALNLSLDVVQDMVIKYRADGDDIDLVNLDIKRALVLHLVHHILEFGLVLRRTATFLAYRANTLHRRGVGRVSFHRL